MKKKKNNQSPKEYIEILRPYMREGTEFFVFNGRAFFIEPAYGVSKKFWIGTQPLANSTNGLWDYVSIHGKITIGDCDDPDDEDYCIYYHSRRNAIRIMRKASACKMSTKEIDS